MGLLVDVFPMPSIYKIYSFLLDFPRALSVYLSLGFLYIDFTYIQMPEESFVPPSSDSACCGRDSRLRIYPCSSPWSDCTKLSEISVVLETTNIGVRGRWNWFTGSFRSLKMEQVRSWTFSCRALADYTWSGGIAWQWNARLWIPGSVSVPTGHENEYGGRGRG